MAGRRGSDGAVSQGMGDRLRLRVAWMYHVEGLTQSEIAEHLGIGRVSVVRLLAEARDRAEVKIWIDGALGPAVALERALEARFGIGEVQVVPVSAPDRPVAPLIGAAAGLALSRALAQHPAGREAQPLGLGVGWGETLLHALPSLAARRQGQYRVVALMGGLTQARGVNPSEFAARVAQILSAEVYLLPAPVLVDQPETRAVLLQRCGLQATFDQVRQLDLVLLSVGTMEAGSTSFQFGLVGEAERRSLLAAGAVGNMLCQFFDAEGRLIDHEVNRRVMAVPLPELRSVPRRILASGGLDKLAALRGAIALVQPSLLIVDEPTGGALLRE